MVMAPEVLARELEYELEAPVPGAEYAVIGPTDDRFHIPARDAPHPGTRRFPYNTICLLEMTASNGDKFTGTGTLITPRVVVTAKHCLMNFPHGSGPPSCRRGRARAPWFTGVRVTPGIGGLRSDGRRLDRPAAPQSILAGPSRFRALDDLDLGVIVLPRPFTALSRGPMRFMMLQPRGATRTATLLTVAGFPCDKPFGTMWGHSGRIPLRSVLRDHLTYTIDTCPGHSGSPVWLLGNDGIRLLLGVHTSGPGGCVNDPRSGRCRRTSRPVRAVRGENCGVRITCGVIDAITRWCREFRVPGPRVDARQYQRACVRPYRP
jgi:glutamyl endopeptidase